MMREQPRAVPSGAYRAFNVATGTGASGSQSVYQGGPQQGGLQQGGYGGRAVQLALDAGYADSPVPGCSLTSPSPPTACCNPAPLHCSSCNGSGYFLLSEAYGS